MFEHVGINLNNPLVLRAVRVRVLVAVLESESRLEAGLQQSIGELMTTVPVILKDLQWL